MSDPTLAVIDPAVAAGSAADDVVLVGQPNVGKSALFGALTRSYVSVSNYPGTTVEITRGRTIVEGRSVPVVDTPGTYSFIPSSEEECVTRDMLLGPSPLRVIAVADAKDLTRGLTLALQLAEMALPFMLCVNMADEAASRGIVIDCEALERELGVAVVPTVAIRRKGLARLRRALRAPRRSRLSVEYPAAIEVALSRIAALLPAAGISPRSLALMVLAGDVTLVPWLDGRLSRETLAHIEDVRQKLRRQFREPLRYLIAQTRHRTAESLSRGVTTRQAATAGNGRRTAAWLERMTIHPLGSLPILALALFAVYEFVGVFGAGTLVDWLENGLFGRWVNPAATRLVESVVPWAVLRDALVGPYGVVSMALTYALALILPIVGTFFIAFGVLEDSGYLPRLAVVLDRAFRKIGLNGRAVLPMVLGLGCDTMATMTTRILPSRKERLIVILLLSLGVPCSAQLAVILAMLGSISGLAVVLWVAVLVCVIALVGALAARVLPGRSSDFIVELPPMRLPRPGNVLLKTVARIEWYLKEAVPLFVIGTLILFAADRFGALEWARRLAEPVVSGVLGLPRETAEAFIIGFLRRDFGAAGLYRLSETGALDGVQTLVAAVTITLFIPCIAQFFMTVKERGWRTGLAIACFVFSFAVGAGGLLNWLLRTLEVSL